MSAIRIFWIGGLISFRALFHWLNPWIYVPTLLVAPLFQILLFVYVGRAARIESDSFFLIGNALQGAAVPCLFAMGHTIAGERFTQTLGLLLTTPASRVPLFLGRAAPVVANGWIVSMFGLGVGGVLVGVDIPPDRWVPLALVVALASASCTGLGLINAALGLKVRQTATFSNIIVGILLVVCGVNVPLAALPTWLRAVSEWLPLTHAVEAARLLADGDTLRSVVPLLGREAGLAAGFIVVGLVILRAFERSSRRTASLERQ
ncbi:ABC transporter permease [Actinoplanes couchii]|uniref:ABC transporter ATP-binding protein n=1 Tax=Actinoplanes couchii TaxID=403638 RepID=A0ABQ3XSJ0_9ACTN|nr:ABC transporter permease [Actinoplanes couchii]MDR6315920.1 ABC-2 type transport system permease protein [Actinoplanes couchii]GID61430.1 ABC transporter ATP-binding protein [Actinoplanes couchii]